MAKSCTVVGGGFKGMISAFLLREKGYEITLIEQAPFLGGIMHSQEWKEKGYFIDNGVHLFDSVPIKLADIVKDVMDGEAHHINFNYASHFNNVTTPNLAIPDFTNIEREVQQKILYEVIEKTTVTPREDVSNLYDRFLDLYGETAADLIDRSFTYIFKVSAKNVEPTVINQTPFHRLRFLPDDMALELKKHPELDNRLAAMRIHRGTVDADLTSVYPSIHGMRGFCDKMKERLEKMGVRVLTGVKIENMNIGDHDVTCKLESGEAIGSEQVLWGGLSQILAKLWLDDDRLLNKLNRTPMVLYALELNNQYINDYTYFHQFSPERITFRPTAAGTFGKQIKEDGSTFVITECPTEIGSELWEDPDKYVDHTWQDCIDMDLIKESAPKYLDYKYFRAPATYCMPKSGSASLLEELDAKIAETNGTLIVPDRNAFVRREIFDAVEASVEQMESM